MKGKKMVIGLLIFVILVIVAIYFSMMSTINNIKEEQEIESETSIMIYQEKML